MKHTSVYSSIRTLQITTYYKKLSATYYLLQPLHLPSTVTAITVTATATPTTATPTTTNRYSRLLLYPAPDPDKAVVSNHISISFLTQFKQDKLGFLSS